LGAEQAGQDPAQSDHIIYARRLGSGGPLTAVEIVEEFCLTKPRPRGQ